MMVINRTMVPQLARNLLRNRSTTFVCLLLHVSFTYNLTKGPKALVKTPAGRDEIAFDDKSLSK